MYRHNLVTVKLPMYTCLLSTSYMPEIKPIKVLQILAGMVELVDTLASGASELMLVEVRILFSVIPKLLKFNKLRIKLPDSW